MGLYVQLFKEITMKQTHIYRLPDILKVTGLSSSTIWRLEKANQFPRRFKISPGAVGWRSHEINAWIDQKVEVSGDGQ